MPGRRDLGALERDHRHRFPRKQPEALRQRLAEDDPRLAGLRACRTACGPETSSSSISVTASEAESPVRPRSTAPFPVAPPRRVQADFGVDEGRSGEDLRSSRTTFSTERHASMRPGLGPLENDAVRVRPEDLLAQVGLQARHHGDHHDQRHDARP